MTEKLYILGYPSTWSIIEPMLWPGDGYIKSRVKCFVKLSNPELTYYVQVLWESWHNNSFPVWPYEHNNVKHLGKSGIGSPATTYL